MSLTRRCWDCQWSLNVASYTSQWTGRTRSAARSGGSAATNIGICSMRTWSSGRGRLLRIWPNTLRSSPKLAEQADADVVVVDSLKDAAVGLSEDEVGAGWNRAAQGLLATGRNLLVLHHRKKQKTNARTGLDDVYGSTWLTSGMGSVVLLDGNPGDPLVEFRHLKFPVSEVGPMKVSHDQASGLLTVAEQVDLVAVAQADGSITVKQAALLLFGSATTNEIEKARRRLDKRVVAGELVKKDEGVPAPITRCLPRSRHAASTLRDPRDRLSDVGAGHGLLTRGHGPPEYAGQAFTVGLTQMTCWISRFPPSL